LIFHQLFGQGLRSVRPSFMLHVKLTHLSAARTGNARRIRKRERGAELAEEIDMIA